MFTRHEDGRAQDPSNLSAIRDPDESMLKDAAEKLEQLHAVNAETKNGRVAAKS